MPTLLPHAAHRLSADRSKLKTDGTCPKLEALVWISVYLLAGSLTSTNQAAEARPSTVAAVRGASLLPATNWPRRVLRAEQTWQLNLPKGERFDASGLVLTPTGDLLTINDRGPSVYRIQFLAQTNAADLIQLTNCFTRDQLRPFAREKMDRYDCEGVALDEQGRLYLCEEVNRWVLRFDQTRDTVERLPIDWTPVKQYFDLSDPNASFEGIAVGGGRIYLANERQMGRIIVVDLATLKVLESFAVRPHDSNARDIHYTDLSYFEGILYVLLRESRCVLAVDPRNQQVVGEFNFKEMEREPQVIYRALFPTGQMEGLAVDKDFIWLVTDNNGTARGRYPTDIRPTLFKCRK
ncbi:MAG: esterase-like activity of phytase family protein [Verrucomicrobiota bacterium]